MPSFSIQFFVNRKSRFLNFFRQFISNSYFLRKLCHQIIRKNFSNFSFFKKCYLPRIIISFLNEAFVGSIDSGLNVIKSGIIGRKGSVHFIRFSSKVYNYISITRDFTITTNLQTRNIKPWVKEEIYISAYFAKIRNGILE